MYSAFILLSLPTPGEQSRQLRLEMIRVLTNWAQQHAYIFRNLYPGNHDPYQNGLGARGPHPDTFDFPNTYLLIEGKGAYLHLNSEKQDVLSSWTEASIPFEISIIPWVEHDTDWPLEPQNTRMNFFRAHWEPAYKSRSDSAVQLRDWGDQSIVVECYETRHAQHNVDTAKNMLRSLLFSQNLNDIFKP
jgi:hypothetical protein